MTHGRRAARRSPAASATGAAAHLAAGLGAAVGATSAGLARVLARVTVLSLLLAGLVVVTGWQPFAEDRTGPRAAAHAVRVDLRKLPEATTRARLNAAPRDRDTDSPAGGEVVRPVRMLPLYAAPGRRPFAKIGPTQIGPTWLPVVARRGAWSKVLLPSRPNGSSGWLRTSNLDRANTRYLIRVHLGSRELELTLDDQVVDSWSVAVGAPETPTPTGRTFLHGSITDPNQSYSPVILPLGAHSATLDTYGGGPGTVALHTWPDPGVFGHAVSHGCIRVPADALDRLMEVPLGTLVLVDNE
jgi:lipoprotein-anchoring transpeptidase ErfK/SrfK